MDQTRQRGCTCILSRADSEDVFALRSREYATAREFEMTRPEMLQWSDHDDDGTVVGIWHDGELISTLRGLVIRSRASAEDIFACTVDLSAEMFPALMFGRGATSATHQRRGLNALLRYYFLDSLRGSTGAIRCSLALPYEGAPRVNLLKSLGYELSRPQKTWDEEAVERTPAMLAVLPRERFADALAQLRDLTESGRVQYAWTGPALQLDAAARAV